MDFDYYDIDSDDFNMTDFNSTLSRSSQFEEYIFIPLLVLIGIVGFLGNSALIFMLSKTNTRSTPNAFILNLAVADLIVIIFHMPFATLLSFSFGDAVCKLSEGSNDFAWGVTAFSLTALTVYCFYETTSTPQSWTSRTTVVAVVGVWVLALTVAVPTMLFAHVVHVHDEEFAIAVCFGFDGQHGTLRFAMYYACPLMAFGFFYCIARLSGTSGRQTVAQRQVSTMTIWLLVVYASCFFLASMTMSWILLIVHDEEFWNILNVIGLYIALSYRCVNPIVLYCVSDSFRQLFSRYLLCWCVKGNREPVSETERNRPLC